MEKIPFREFHILKLLSEYTISSLPLDAAIYRYFKLHKALGSKDRYEISETCYALVRWQGLLDALGREKIWTERLRIYQQDQWRTKGKALPPHIRCSFPEDLFKRISNTFGEEGAFKLCLACNSPAPTCIRVNTLKISRDELLNRWKDQFNISPTQHSPDGIIFKQKIHFYSLPEFQKGLFEMQDEASQLVAKLIKALPGEHVLDYCAGAGGKALAIAPSLQGKGQLYLHDVRAHALTEAKQRLRRAGVQNIQTLQEGHPSLNKLKKKMDWVLVDAPCTGTGTLRRNPDMKWRYSDEMLERLLGQQRMIFEKALSYMHPEGHIVYATCSLLNEENEQQLEHFLRVYDLVVEGTPLKTIPKEGEMDGFFGVVLKRRV